MGENENTNVNTTTEAEDAKNEAAEEQNEGAEVSKLKADLLRQKQALDKATKEAADYKKQLRARQTAEEAAEEDRKAQEEARDKELSELRMRFAVMENSKNVLAKIGGDEAAAGRIAEFLYGASDPDGVLTEIGKIIAAREKAIRAEYGKVPAPGAGSADGPVMTKADILSIKDSVARQRAIAENNTAKK